MAIIGRLQPVADSSQTDGMSEELQIRVHGQGLEPTLVYLPGLHGDWTLVSSFRAALTGRVCFVEFTYPRTLTWSLDDYAAAIEEALLAHISFSQPLPANRHPVLMPRSPQALMWQNVKYFFYNLTHWPSPALGRTRDRSVAGT